MELNEAFGLIMKGVESTMSDHGFSVVVPSGTEKGAVPVAVKNGSTVLTYTGQKGSAKIEFLEGKISLLCAQSQAAQAVDDDYKKITMTLFNPETADSRDIKYIARLYIIFVQRFNQCVVGNHPAECLDIHRPVETK